MLAPLGDAVVIAGGTSDPLEYAKHVEFESGDLALALDADGSIYLGGAEIVPDGAATANVTVARFDADAQLTWLKRFAHTGSTAYAHAIALAKNGDVVITGRFNGSVSFGGDTLTTQAMLGSRSFTPLARRCLRRVDPRMIGRLAAARARRHARGARTRVEHAPFERELPAEAALAELGGVHGVVP